MVDGGVIDVVVDDDPGAIEPLLVIPGWPVDMLGCVVGEFGSLVMAPPA